MRYFTADNALLCVVVELIFLAFLSAFLLLPLIEKCFERLSYQINVTFLNAAIKIKSKT